MIKLNIRRYYFDIGPHSDIKHVVYIDQVDIIQLCMSLEFNPLSIINNIISGNCLSPYFYSLIPFAETFLCETYFIYCYTILEARLLIYLLFFEKVKIIYCEYFKADIAHTELLFNIFNTYIFQESKNLDTLIKYSKEEDNRYYEFAKFINTRMTIFIKAYMSGFYRELYGNSIGVIDNGFVESIIREVSIY